MSNVDFGMPMNEIVPGLWLGDLNSALDVESLTKHNIFSILTAMRGRIMIKETFIRHQILLDDSEFEDILTHLMSAIHFIQAELGKGRGVLVHCQAGISRSTTIVAAYLMYNRGLHVEEAIDFIRQKRPQAEPNEGFMRQLTIFHKAHCKVSRKDKPTRMFYVDRAAGEVMNGDGSPPETNMFAKFPGAPSNSNPATPGRPRRRIRCKKCRQELAAREHMLDHGQLGPATPAATTPAHSRRPSSTVQPLSRHPPLPTPDVRPRRASLLGLGGFGESLSMSTIEPTKKQTARSSSMTETGSFLPLAGPLLPAFPRVSGGLPEMPSSALEDESGDELSEPSATKCEDMSDGSKVDGVIDAQDDAIEALGRRLSDAIIASPPDHRPDPNGAAPAHDTLKTLPTANPLGSGDIATDYVVIPKLTTPRALGGTLPQAALKAFVSHPILANQQCSGYFVEPMQWMESFLSAGQLAGKITCPNRKCGAKLGNYDWAGMRCGCNQWVIPAFCINRSKVDEMAQ